MNKWLCLFGFVALGCTGDNTDGGKDDDAPIPNGPGSQGCGDTNPSIDGFEIEYAGMRDFDEGTFPTLGVTVNVTDEDRDLTYYEYRVWWDDVIDGVVATEGFYAETYGTVDGDDCEVGAVTLTMYLGVAGGEKSPPLSTELEFGAVVRDDKTNESNDGKTIVQVFTTPDSDGNF
jgi:hypothetical protein